MILVLREQDLQKMVILALLHFHGDCSWIYEQVLQVTGLLCHALLVALVLLSFFPLKDDSPFLEALTGLERK